MDKRFEQMMMGFNTAYINYERKSNPEYCPQFISNDYKVGKKILTYIEQQMYHCDEFMISVAFITMGGIAPLLQVFKDLERKGVKGKIMTTNYLTFSEPKALRHLAKLTNIELKMYCVDGADPGFHTKGYIFRDEEIYRILIGSANMTLNALTKNKEWNANIISTDQGEFTRELFTEFNYLWEQAKPLKEWIETYTQIYNDKKRVIRQENVSLIQRCRLEPNHMQIDFVKNLQEIKRRGEKRALLISATGTGKTYASAFALRSFNAKKVLFLIHREQIAKQAIDSYKNVFGEEIKMGLLSGNSRETEVDFLFSTMQMMAKKDIRESFSSNEFQIIVVDEAHRVGAASYQAIMNYFTPEFWLGMTASPERTDDFDVFEAFDHNIAYEIRLQQALEEDLLCPFHYFGITDLEIDGETFNDNSGLRNFNLLISEKRVDYILEKANYYGFSGDRVKGLIFCSTQKEAIVLSEKFNERGYYTVALTGRDSQSMRENAIEKLVSDDESNRLDYIFTVDIFNEGVDIPAINQIIMLRPTKSPIVFVQQLGRGLRKAEHKEYVVILDFIGNYKNNFMIPIALSGDRSYNKDTIRRYLLEGTKIIPGSSSIHFDEISKRRIFESIDKTSITKKLLSEKYFSLKNRLGRIPSILDFYDYSEIDPLLFVEYSGTYYKFVKSIDTSYDINISDGESKIIEFISNFLVNGKRPHELLILKLLIKKGDFNKEDVNKQLSHMYNLTDNVNSIDSAIHLLEGKFINSASDKKRYADIELLSLDKTGYYRRVMSFYKALSQNDFYEMLDQLLKLGLNRYNDIYKDIVDESGLALYQKYSRKDVCRILNWQKDDSSTIYGYKIKNGTCPIFVTYEKKDTISNSTKYEDQFINNKIFSWMTRSRVSIDSTESRLIINSKKIGLKIFLFIKKSDGEGSDFYYLGQVEPIRWRQTTINNDGGKSLPIMNFELELFNPVREDIYDYFTS